MHCLKSARRLARHRFALFIALLSTTSPLSAAFGAEVTVNDGDSYVNSGTAVDIYGAGDVGTIENRAGAKVGAAPNVAVEVVGNVGTFINAGTIIGDGDGVNIGGDVAAFTNAAGASIESIQFSGVFINGAVMDFVNAGRIYGTGWGVFLNGGAASVTNAAGGSIESAGEGMLITGDVGSFSNAGRLSGVTSGLYLDGDVASFVNLSSGEIVALDNGVSITGSVASITNDGVIRSSSGSPTFLVWGDVGSFTNRGVIAGGGWGVGLGSVDSFYNSGTIAALGPGPRIGVLVDSFAGSGSANSFVNTGTIEATGTAVRFEKGVVQMVNSGVLRGGVYALDSYGVYDDSLTLLTGSRIFGALSFGGGYDTLDFSRFVGNTILDVGGLEKLVPGTVSYVDARGGGAAGKIAIFDISGLGNKAIGRDLDDATASVRSLVAQQLAGQEAGRQAPIAALGYGPSRPTTGAAAALNGFDSVPAADVVVWGGAVGGGSVDRDPLDQASRFGGLVAGSHARVGDRLILGGLASYISSSSSLLGDQEILETQTGMVGLYGKANLGVVDLDFTLLGGVNGHVTKRQVVAGGTTETARGAFSSVFVAPGIGGSIPVLSFDATTLLVRGETSYVAGLTTAYTETGSSMNLAVGEQTIGLFDVRVGLEARHAIDNVGSKTELVARFGVRGQANMGSSSVSVTTLGQTVDVGTPGNGSYGLYGGLGFDMAVNDSFALNMSLNGSAGADGRINLGAGAGLKGAF